MYNSTEYSDDYLKTFGILWQYCGEKPVINAANGAMANFTADNADTNLFEIKEKKQQVKQATMAQKMLKQWYH